LTHVFHAVVAGAIDLDHIQAVACGDLEAVMAHSAWRNRRAVNAVERFRQNPCGRSLANAARADK